jgi:hypothetical protein
VRKNDYASSITPLREKGNNSQKIIIKFSLKIFGRPIA